MTRRAPRPDISYISRRTKRTPLVDGPSQNGANLPQAEPGVPPGPGPSMPPGSLPTRSSNDTGLTLRRPQSASAVSTSSGQAAGNPGSPGPERLSPAQHSRWGAAAAQQPTLQPGLSSHLFPAPAFSSVRHLSEETPVARLNSRQAGIGTLLISGVHSTAWEGTTLITGAEIFQVEKMGTSISTSGNRPLVAFHEASVAVALRHVRQLRRAIFIAADAPLIVGVFGGAAAAVSPRNSNGEKAVLHLARIGELLELRADYIKDADYPDIWARFGFRMTTPVNVRPARH
jgi:hypothetical protein